MAWRAFHRSALPLLAGMRRSTLLEVQQRVAASTGPRLSPARSSPSAGSSTGRASTSRRSSAAPSSGSEAELLASRHT